MTLRKISINCLLISVVRTQRRYIHSENQSLFFLESPSGEIFEINELDWSMRHAVQKRLLDQQMGCGTRWSSGHTLGLLIQEYGFVTCGALHRRSVPNRTSTTEWAQPATQTTSRYNSGRSIERFSPVKDRDGSLRALLRVCCSWSNSESLTQQWV